MTKRAGPPRGGTATAAEEGNGAWSGLRGALGAQEERLSHCVHCGFCLPACPTYVRLHDEANSPRGRLYLMRAVIEGRLDPAADAFQLHLDRCLGCRACETVCPSGVEYGFLLERAREVAGQARPAGRLSRAFLSGIRRPFLFRTWMGVSRLLRWTGTARLLARALPSRRGLRTARLGSAMLAASRPWRPGGEREGRAEGAERDSRAVPRGRVGCLLGCVQDHLFRHVNEATRRVLQANGWAVVKVPGQGCCGALHAHAGRLSEAREMARRNVRAFRAEGVEWIVVNAAGCGATMREYAHLLDEGSPEDRENARWFSERVRDVSEVLAGPGARLREGGRLPLRVAYDPPCHLLHGQGVETAPPALLRSIPGVEVIPVPNGDECCGGAGIYAVTHPELGGRIGSDKVDAVIATGAELLATGNPGCAMQIGAGLLLRGSSIRVVHPIELVDESYRRAGHYFEETES